MEATIIDNSDIVKVIEDWEVLINNSSSFEGRLDWLTEKIAVIAGQMTEMGDLCSAILKEEDRSLNQEVALSCHLVTFVWAEQAKMFLLLMRDSLFEQQKAAILYKDANLKEKKIHGLWQQTYDLLKEALQGVKEITLQKSTEAEVYKQLDRLKHQ
jgi:hypothetical protein